MGVAALAFVAVLSGIQLEGCGQHGKGASADVVRQICEDCCIDGKYVLDGVEGVCPQPPSTMPEQECIQECNVCAEQDIAGNQGLGSCIFQACPAYVSKT